jgi:serine/threonine protein kinase
MDGTPFGRYRLIGLLGRGGMGEVWRAHDTDTDRIVALKLLPAHMSEDEEFQRRFRREAHAAARLNDPHVIPIHYYGEIDGRLYVDMRLIEGRDLGTVLAEGPLEAARAVRIIEQVAMALHAAHKVGLLHRDVKPSNILLDGNDFAYLIDFGIARAADETRMTKSGSTIGTFHYIAPERLEIGADEDARADIYSLACVLYECLTGDPPFAADTTPRLIAAHLNAPPPRPSTTRPDVPAKVDEVIATGMAKNPDQRYATTIELADAARDAITVPIQRPTPSAPTLPATEQAPLPPTEQAPHPGTAQPTVKAESPVPAKEAMHPAFQQAASVGSPKRARATWVVPLILAVLLAGAGAFAVTQVLRPDPQLSTAAPQWQPYVDFAKQFTVSLTSLSAQSADSDVQRILDESTGAFHDDVANRRSDFQKVVVQSNATSQATVGSAALESIYLTTAQVLVAATSKVTNNGGATQEPRWRLRVQVEKIGDAYKASKVEFVS